MAIEKLCKDDFVDVMRGQPTVRFTDKGVVFFNRAAIKHLKLCDRSGYYGVSICRDNKCPSDFSVMRDDDCGWRLRSATAGGGVFNCVGLARHVIDQTWERCRSHPVGAVKPRSWVFRIARLPIDDDKNSNVFALIRKKE